MAALLKSFEDEANKINVAKDSPPQDEIEMANQGFRDVTRDAFLRAQFNDIRMAFDKVFLLLCWLVTFAIPYDCSFHSALH